MKVYNLLLNIVLLTLPFRNTKYLLCDIYGDYLDSKIDYNEFSLRMFKLAKEDIEILNYDDFLIVLESIYPIYKYFDLVDFYLEILNRLGKSLLKLENYTVYVNNVYNDDESKDIFYPFVKDERIIAWYYFTQFMNTDTIIINHIINQVSIAENYLQDDVYSSQPNIFNVYQNQVFKNGFYETHIHFGGSIHFNKQWWYLVGKYNNGKNNKRYKIIDELSRLSLSEFNYRYWILASIIFRYCVLMIITLKNKDDLKKYLGEMQFLEMYSKGIEKYSINELYDFIEEIQGKVLIETGYKSIDDNIDFIDQFIRGKKQENNEIWFEYLCLDFLKKQKSNVWIIYQIIIKGIFNYWRVKNSVFALGIHNSNVKGLSYFQRHYNFNRNNIQLIGTKDKLKSVLNYYDKQQFIKGIELKIASASLLDEERLIYKYNIFINDLLDGYEEWLISRNEKSSSMSQQNIIKLGFIILFTKHKLNHENKCINDYFINDDIHALSYQSLQHNMMIETMVIQHLRNEVNELECFLLGIDVAGNENDTPPNIYAPIYRSLRNGKHEILDKNVHSNIKSIFNKLNFYPSKELGFTYHVGEVFASIISGLRHIDEVIDHFNYTRGDRIGHATALSIDLKYFLRDKKMTQIRKIDYLYNLLWLRHLIVDDDVNLANLNTLYLEGKILKVFYDIFGSKNKSNKKTIDIDVLMQWYKIQFEFVDVQISLLNKKICPLSFCPKQKNFFSSDNGEWKLDELIATNHCKFYLNKMNESLRISEGNNDLEIYTKVQEYVKGKVASKGIVVEINPISNSSIGEIPNVTLFPYINLNSMGLDGKKNSHIIGSINTDDPSVFNNNLIMQYAILEAQLSAMGYSKDEIYNWLKYLREKGEESTFLPMQFISSSDIIKAIKVVKSELTKLK